MAVVHRHPGPYTARPITASSSLRMLPVPYGKVRTSSGVANGRVCSRGMHHILDRRDDDDWPSVLRRRLHDRKRASSDRDEGRRELARDLPEAVDRLGPQPVPHVRALPLRADPAGLAEHLQVVADGWLSHLAAGREVAGADAVPGRELAQDREPGRVCCALEKQCVRVVDAFHLVAILTRIDMDANIRSSTFIDTSGSEP